MRYIGSKARIIDFISRVVEDTFGDCSNAVFADLFSGTASVALHFKNKGAQIISNDYLYFSYALQVAKIKLNVEPICVLSYKEALEVLNKIPGKEGFFVKEYTLEGTSEKEYKRNYFSFDGLVTTKLMKTCIFCFQHVLLTQ